jgi:hypothetical protein
MSCCSAPTSRTGRILFTVFYLLPAILYTDSALSHAHTTVSPLNRWLFAAFWWLFAAIMIWRLFRPAQPSCRPDPALSIAPHSETRIDR